MKQKDGRDDITGSGNGPICIQTDGTRLTAVVAPDRMNDVVSTDQVDSHNSITVVRQYMPDVPRDDAHGADDDHESDGRMTHLVRLHAIQTETYYASVAADPSHPPTGRACNKSMTITVSQPTHGRAGAADTARELTRHRSGGRCTNNRIGPT